MNFETTSPETKTPRHPAAVAAQIASVRLVRVELVAYYQPRDADGDPVGAELPLRSAQPEDRWGPLVWYGKGIEQLPQQLREQEVRFLEQLRAPAEAEPQQLPLLR